MEAWEKILPLRRIIYLEPESTGRSEQVRFKKMRRDMGFNDCLSKIIPIVKKLIKRIYLAEDKAKEQYQAKWDILNALPKDIKAQFLFNLEKEK